jgi:sulfur-oxidizing protein SoxZ
MRIRARLRDGAVELLVLVPHPMETGRGERPDGASPAPNYIDGLAVWLGDVPVIRARLGMAVSRDPLISLRIAGAGRGDRLRVECTDNLGTSRSTEVVVQ